MKVVVRCCQWERSAAVLIHDYDGVFTCGVKKLTKESCVMLRFVCSAVCLRYTCGRARSARPHCVPIGGPKRQPLHARCSPGSGRTGQF